MQLEELKAFANSVVEEAKKKGLAIALFVAAPEQETMELHFLSKTYLLAAWNLFEALNSEEPSVASCAAVGDVNNVLKVAASEDLLSMLQSAMAQLIVKASKSSLNIRHLKRVALLEQTEKANEPVT